jgi:hypothetical protein
MADGTQSVESVARKYLVLRPHLDERQRRLFLGAEAQEFGRGGITVVAAATGVHPDTIARGIRELAGEAEPAVRVRATGGGRKSLAESDPGLFVAAQGFRGSGDSRGPDVAAGLDDKIDAEPGRCVDEARASGQ